MVGLPCGRAPGLNQNFIFNYRKSLAQLLRLNNVCKTKFVSIHATSYIRHRTTVNKFVLEEQVTIYLHR